MWTRALLLVAVVSVLAVAGDGGDQDNSVSNQLLQLKVGRAIDVFTRYGYLSLSMKVVPRNDSDSAWIFREPTVDVFNGVDNYAVNSRSVNKKAIFNGDFHMEFCDNVRQLLQAYFRDFNFERLDKPWRAFTGSWGPETVARHLGINSSFIQGENNCFVLVRLSRFRNSVKLSRIPNNINLADIVAKEMDNIQVGDVASVLEFIRKFGSHYIASYVTGNSLYQVYVYKRQTYQRIKDRLKTNGIQELSKAEISQFFSPWYADHVGQIKVASGNRSVEEWVSQNIRVSYYIFNYPTLMKIHGNPQLLAQLNGMLQNEALLEIDLKTLAPAFKDPTKRQWFLEVMDNVMKLWEVNL